MDFPLAVILQFETPYCPIQYSVGLLVPMVGFNRFLTDTEAIEYVDFK